MELNRLIDLVAQRELLATQVKELGSKYADMLHEFTSQLKDETVFAVDNRHFLYREGKIKEIPVIGGKLPSTPISDQYRQILTVKDEYKSAVQELHSINLELRFLVNEHLNLVNAQNCLIVLSEKAYLLDHDYPVQAI